MTPIASAPSKSSAVVASHAPRPSSTASSPSTAGRSAATSAARPRRRSPSRLSTAVVARNVRDDTPDVSTPACSGSTTSPAAASGDAGWFVTATTRLVPRWRSATATVSGVRPDAEIATRTMSRDGGVAASADANSTQAGTPAARSCTAASSAAYRELPRPAKTTRTWPSSPGSSLSGPPVAPYASRRPASIVGSPSTSSSSAAARSVVTRSPSGRASPRSAPTATPAGTWPRTRTRSTPSRSRRP